MKHAFVFALLLAIATPLQAAEAQINSLRIYYVGNSVTDTIRYGSLAKLAATRNVKMTWGGT